MNYHGICCRIAAARLWNAGRSVATIAAQADVTQGTVRRWLRDARPLLKPRAGKR